MPVGGLQCRLDEPRGETIHGGEVDPGQTRHAVVGASAQHGTPQPGGCDGVGTEHHGRCQAVAATDLVEVSGQGVDRRPAGGSENELGHGHLKPRCVGLGGDGFRSTTVRDSTVSGPEVFDDVEPQRDGHP